VNNPDKETGKHQPNSCFRVNRRTAVVLAVTLGNFVTEPVEFKYPVDTTKNVIIGNEVTQ
jgi:hypothetical protein